METLFDVCFKLLVSLSGATLILGGIIFHVFLQIHRGEKK